MWNTDSLWFELAIVMSIFAIGNILFGHFEEHKPKWKRVMKVFVVTSVFVALSAWLGRAWAFSGLAVLWLVGVVVIHGWWLPKHGINGWTGEPREKYYALIKARK